MALNIDGFETAECELDLNGSVKLLDLYCENVYDAGKKFTLKPYESKILLIDYQGESAAETKNETVVLPAKGYEVVSSDENYMVLDTAKFSFDGKKYTPSHPIPAIFEHLIKTKYNGDLYLSDSGQNRPAREMSVKIGQSFSSFKGKREIVAV